MSPHNPYKQRTGVQKTRVTGVAWATGLDQLTDYMKLVRTEEGQKREEPLYGLLNIDTYTRLYQLNDNEERCIDFPGTNGKTYELAEDEAEVGRLLETLIHTLI